MVIGPANGLKATARKTAVKRTIGSASAFLIVASVLAGFCFCPSIAATQIRTEQQLLDVLKSNAGLQEKDAAMAELKRVGTARSVPALAEFLTDDPLSHAARFALESMPAPEAGAALLAALDKTGGLIKAGIIYSLGQRQEIGAVAALGRLLADPDPNVAGAAATALGRIGDPAAVQSLFAALPRHDPAELRAAILDGLLAAANQELAAGRRNDASSVFSKLFATPASEHVRAAAYRGLIAAADEKGAVRLIKTGIDGTDPAMQMAAVQMAGESSVSGVARILCESLGAASPALKIALIEALRQRADPAASLSLLMMAKSPETGVRLAALAGLGELGDTSAVPVLLAAAASGDDAEARTARLALLVLKRGDVMRVLPAQVSAGVTPAARIEAARALSGRGDKDAVAGLIAAARENSGPVRGAICSSIGQLAGVSDIPALVGLVTSAKEDVARDQARDALGACCLRLQSQGIPVDAKPIVDGLAGAGPQARAALLQAGSVLADERLRGDLRSALTDSEATLRDAAAQALCETRDPGLLADMLNYAGQTSDLSRRVMAIRGYVRLATDMESVKLTPAERVKALKDILPAARDEEKWAVLAGLAKFPDLSSLELARTMLDDPATRTEAAQAVVSIASGLASTRREHARSALERVMAQSAEPGVHQAALAALQQIDPTAGSGSAISFRRVKVDGAFRSEGVAVADFNRDGHLDIATGNILYLGPDWNPRPMLGTAKEYKPENYSDEFLCFADDIDHDGWLDLIVVGFPGAKTRWLRNPGRRGGPWKEFLAIEKTGNESPDWVDVGKDGRKELVFVSENGMAFARPGADPTKPWPIRVIAGPDDPKPGHGLGVGDINGDGRNDVVCPEGWWEGPVDPSRVPWIFHRAKLGFEAPAQMPALDVNGDGRADVLSSGAHRYGLWWYEQAPEGWLPHEIDHNISQLHALHVADINRDGLPDLVTGKRFWAHREGDDGIDDPAVLCWFEMKRENGKPTWIRHDIDLDSGVGLHFAIVNLNGDGLLDVVTSNKKGVYVFMQEKK